MSDLPSLIQPECSALFMVARAPSNKFAPALFIGGDGLVRPPDKEAHLFEHYHQSGAEASPSPLNGERAGVWAGVWGGKLSERKLRLPALWN